MPAANPPIRVRRLRSTDSASWRQLWDAYLAFYRADVPDPVTARTLQRLCEAEAMVGLVAVDGSDAPVGLAHLVFHPGTWSMGGSCYLEDLFVHPAHRGGGSARALFAAVDDEARRRGVTSIYWHTQAFNGPARSLYDTVGTLTSFVVYQRSLGGQPPTP